MKALGFVGWMGAACIVWIGAVSGSAPAQQSKELDKRVAEFTLSNGMRFLVLERHESPSVSFNTYIGAGSVNEPLGQSGMTRLLERMAVKGSETIGTRNWPEERKALEGLDEAYDRLEAERNKGPRMDQEKFGAAHAQWRLANDVAQRYANPEEYNRILHDNGATQVRSTANWTSTQFGYTLPSNRLELWFLMESQRLIHPVLRDFYNERDKLVEEQQKGQSNVQSRVFETLLATAFFAHPYRVPAGGWASDIAELKRTEAKAFLDRYYVPGNITAALVGDIDPAEVKRMAERYFGPMPARPLPPQVLTVEPPQVGPRTAILTLPAQPMAAIAYKRPGYLDRDDTVLDVLQNILASGKQGIAYHDLVEVKRVATGLQAGATFPDGRYPNLFLFFLAPSQGHTVEEAQKALDEVLLRLRSQKIGTDELNRAKAEVQAFSYRRLESNSSMAEMLSLYSAYYGDWKKLFTLIDDVRTVTEDELNRAAQRYFVPSNRTFVYTALPAPVVQPRTGGGE